MRAEHHAALQAILACHQAQSVYPSCGHRSCPACQHGTNNQWQARTGHYLFNGRALAKVFRGKFLTALREQGLTLPDNLPRQWVAQCEHVGRGEQALTYLARYLYRGVLSEQNILAYDGEQVSFRYQDSATGDWKTLTEPVIRFLWRVLQHVLPKGFRRARDYGFLHGNARRTLQRLQLLLRTPLPETLPSEKRQPRLCPDCGQAMSVTLRRRPCLSPIVRQRR